MPVSGRIPTGLQDAVVCPADFQQGVIGDIDLFGLVFGKIPIFVITSYSIHYTKLYDAAHIHIIEIRMEKISGNGMFLQILEHDRTGGDALVFNREVHEDLTSGPVLDSSFQILDSHSD